MNFYLQLAFLAVAVGSSATFRLEPTEENINEDRIVGGATAKLGEHPYAVSLRKLRKIDAKWIHHCGGSLLSNRWILTTASCNSYATTYSDYRVQVGAFKIDGDGETYYIDQTITHHDYEPLSGYNDIGLLRTNTTVLFSNLVRPIPLSKEFIGDEVNSLVVGWGKKQVRKQIH